MLRADNLHAYVFVYMRTCLHVLAYMLASLYAFICLHMPVLLNAYVLSCLLAGGKRSVASWVDWARLAGLARLAGWAGWAGCVG